MEKNITLSPKVKLSPPPVAKEIGMTFPEAIAELLKGNKIRRKEWPETDYGILKDGWLGIHRNGELFQHWKINDGDMLSTDWIAINEAK